MRYLDVCAGISASSVAWKPLGWDAAAYSEIEPAPRAILEHRQGALPVGWDHRHAAGSNTTPLFGDFTQIEAHHVGPIDLLVGGTPCQDFSIAGLRKGLAGDRGNLTLEYVRLADRLRPRWLAWENVPGVLSIDGGRAFGAFLRGLAELGYGFAYRVLDAQHFGVPQRRRRVILVAYLGDWRRAAAVLFERHSMCGDTAPLREADARVAPPLARGSPSSGGYRLDADTAEALVAEIASTLPAGGNSTGGARQPGMSAETAGSYLVAQKALAFCQNSRNEVRMFGGDGQTAGALAAEPGMKQQTFLAFSIRGRDGGSQPEPCEEGLAPSLRVSAGGSSHVFLAEEWRVRRLTARECERLQGFPDDYTLVPNRGKPMADGPRYKALGNSMAVPVMRWIGERIAAVDAMPLEQRDAA